MTLQERIAVFVLFVMSAIGFVVSERRGSLHADRIRDLETHANRTDRKIKAMSNAFDQLVSDLDAETTAIAARIDVLTAEVQANADRTITDAQLAQFGAISARLKGLGTNPTAPIPTPVDPTAPLPAPTDGTATPTL